jgi:hypothetical protein
LFRLNLVFYVVLWILTLLGLAAWAAAFLGLAFDVLRRVGAVGSF